MSKVIVAGGGAAGMMAACQAAAGAIRCSFWKETKSLGKNCLLPGKAGAI